jgi:hypothetical protein
MPADLANPESSESVSPLVGKVWYPDTAFKMAQAICDFHKGGPLVMIFGVVLAEEVVTCQWRSTSLVP